MYTDNHNHTKHFSSDAKMTAQQLIDTCKGLNMYGVAVTEHYEGDYPHDIGAPQIFDLDSYFETGKTWKEYAGDFPVRMGIELGWQKHLPAFYDEMVSKYPFDVVILSNHLFRGKDPYFFRDGYEQDMVSVYTQYIEEMAQMAEDCSNYDIIGHYDYINRYGPYEDPQIRYAHCPEAFDRLFKAIISKGKALEINTRSIDKMRKRGFDSAYSMPDPGILSRYYEMGGRIIAMGSDSHDNDTLCIHFDETARYLASFGFTENSYFVGRTRHGEPLIPNV
ncbi:MAG: histidinol-phosphatase HisJ family protein [Clostridiales bacterium]|nr:histidinol-phosphatase HisJ family protein [Clostridiales bacterium]